MDRRRVESSNSCPRSRVIDEERDSARSHDAGSGDPNSRRTRPGPSRGRTDWQAAGLPDHGLRPVPLPDEKEGSRGKKHQKSIHIKEVKFRPNTDEHDYEFKKNHIIRFLKQGDKVKANVWFRGREIVHTEIGRALIARLMEELEDIGFVETRPKMEGKNLIAIFAPKKEK